MRPRSAGDERTGRLMSTVSRARRSAIAWSFSADLRAVIASATVVFSALIWAPRVWRSSGVIVPSVFKSSEIEPFLPSAPTRTASIDPSSPAASISASSVRSSVSSSLILSCLDAGMGSVLYRLLSSGL
ncbi:hypothetical protein D3C71_1793810 [compost metagenome]